MAGSAMLNGSECLQDTSRNQHGGNSRSSWLGNIVSETTAMSKTHCTVVPDDGCITAATATAGYKTADSEIQAAIEVGQQLSKTATADALTCWSVKAHASR